MDERVRFGILGCGRIVERGLAPGIAASPHARLWAIASERPGVAAEWAARHPEVKAYDSYADLLEDQDVQAVYVPCTGDLHHRWTIAAARAGKHVLCEKPLARSVSEAREMLAACDAAGVLLQEAFMWRHHPRAARAKQLLAEGAIGPLRLLVVSFSFDIDRSDWRMSPERGGGALWDIGCYGVNCSRFFTGQEPTGIHARGHWSQTGVDMTMQLTLAFPGDVLANIDCSFEAPFRCRAELVGERGRMILDDAFLPRAGAAIELERATERDRPTERVVVETADQYGCQVTALCESIRAGRLLPPAENGLANMQVLETAYTSARRWHG
jgi:predicted dehydrogenase